MAAGTVALLPGFVARWKRGAKLAGFMAKWIMTAYLLGFIAVIPGILGNIGLPDSFTRGWWMNGFVLHPIINRLVSGGLLLGEVIVAICSGMLYILTLAAIVRERRGNRAGNEKEIV